MRKVILLLFITLNMIAIRSFAISAKSAVLIDSASGRILYEHNAYEKMPMASTTKIMTGLLACESGKLAKNVKTSAFASGTEGSSLWLKIGEKQTLEDLTYGLMLKSGNDAAVAIAEYLGGSVEAFALMMNQRAKEIGAENTSFKNPHGLDAEEHFTTAYDLALIAREAMKNKIFRQIVSTKTYSIPMEGEKWDRALKNHNKMLWRYDGCNGVKTGFTKKCGRCLVTSAKKGKEELICVTLNAPSDWSDHTKLLDYGFENYENNVLYKKGEKVCDYTYDKKNAKKVSLVCEDGFSALLCKGESLDSKIEFHKLKAPAKKGTVAATAHIFCNGKKIADIDLVTGAEIKAVTYVEKEKNKLKNLIHKLLYTVKKRRMA